LQLSLSWIVKNSGHKATFAIAERSQYARYNKVRTATGMEFDKQQQ
jgi:hypothetical protein